MNLLTEAWLPVRRRDGGREWVSPDQLARSDLVAFDANRADFNGALAQFAIGLLQTAFAPRTETGWAKLYQTAPDAATLQAAFAPHAAAFELDGDGARFMQDFSLKAEDAGTCDIGALLIESPGENTVRNNADHFVKRAQVPAICPHCAASALFTLQLNAPSGGAGHRTSVRGGGPLTTLVQAVGDSSLWQNLWLNVMPNQAQAADEARIAPHFTFPWLVAQERLQKDGGDLAPVAMHSNHIYWTMPRRIRLDFQNCSSGTCAICGRDGQSLVSSYITKNYGLNYKGAWRHPLSPYYELKEELLPQHPQPGGLGYGHWLGWVLGTEGKKSNVHPALLVKQFFSSRNLRIPGQLQLWAFGYDMDNMKARCWYEASLPLYVLGEFDEGQKQAAVRILQTEVGYLLATAEFAAGLLRQAVRDAWFERDARGDFEHVNAAFWSSTEESFYRHLQNLIQNCTQTESSTLEAVRKDWLAEVGKVAQYLFDRVLVGSADITQENPARTARAFRKLCRMLRGKLIREVAGLPELEPPASKPGKAGAGKKSKKSDTEA